VVSTHMGCGGSKESNAALDDGPARASGGLPTMHGLEGLKILLTNPSVQQYLLDFTKQEFSDENYKFWLAVNDFRRINPVHHEKMKEIMETFVKPGATEEVNIPSDVRGKCVKLAEEGGTQTMFDVAQDEIYSLMEKDTWNRFKTSEQCEKMLSSKAAKMSGITREAVNDCGITE